MMRVAIQMDPIESIKVATDSSYLIGLEAQKRGGQLYYYTPQKLTYDQGKIVARGHRLTLFPDHAHYYELGPQEMLALDQMDYVFIRQDPPFDMAYITTTYLLELLPSRVRVINNPTAIRNCAEKTYPLTWQKYMPPTMISADPVAVQDFFAQHRDIVIKPLYGHGGSGVVHVTEASNIGGLMDVHKMAARTPVIAQKFVEAVREGDKRIIMMHGDVIGSFKRVPQEGNFRSNTALGGKAVLCDLTQEEQQMCAELGQDFKKRGLMFVGLDVIGGFLTEINLTSPTGLCYLNPHIDKKGQEILWDKLLGGE